MWQVRKLVCVFFLLFFSSINFFTMILMNCMNICHLLEAVKCALANGGSGFLSINTTSALLLVVKLKWYDCITVLTANVRLCTFRHGVYVSLDWAMGRLWNCHNICPIWRCESVAVIVIVFAFHFQQNTDSFCFIYIYEALDGAYLAAVSHCLF